MSLNPSSSQTAWLTDLLDGNVVDLEVAEVGLFEFVEEDAEGIEVDVLVEWHVSGGPAPVDQTRP